MSDARAAGTRIDDLETHLAHQESTIQDLSETVGQQWETIDVLKREINRLKDRLSAMEGELQSAQSDERPPPHY